MKIIEKVADKILRRGTKHCASALILLAILCLTAALPTTARADNVVITGGLIVIDSVSREMRVSLTGGGLTINSTVSDAYLPPGFSFISSTFNCGCDGFGLTTFNNLAASAFAGLGTFNDSTLSGSITLYGFFDETLNQPPFPFTVSYTGRGVLVRTPTRTTFTITSPTAAVPEPATLLLLGTGLAGVAVKIRRRSKQKSDRA